MNLKIHFNSNDEYNYIRDNIPESMLINDDINDSGIFYIYYVPLTKRWVAISRRNDRYDALEDSLKDYVTDITTMNFSDFFGMCRTKKINDILYG